MVFYGRKRHEPETESYISSDTGRKLQLFSILSCKKIKYMVKYLSMKFYFIAGS